MSGSLKPGWADAAGKAAAETTNEPPEWKLWRSRGEKPFKRPDWKMKESARRGGFAAHNGARGALGRKLVKVLGKVESDD